MSDDAVAANRDLWDKRVRAHLQFGLYPSARVEDGTYDVGEPEISEIGDVRGLRLVHLQCNAGADTLAWARRGAIATGVDFSVEAIAEARRLSSVTGVDATFVCADLYALPDDLGPFDLAYTSMGVLWWLPDLGRWAVAVARLLLPGGRFYLHEIHPISMALTERDGRIELTDDYYGPGEPIVLESTGTYYDAPPEFVAETAMEHGTIHTVGDVISALAGAGLRIDRLVEHPSTTYKLHESLVWGDDGRWTFAPGRPRIPLTFSVLATRV